MSASGPTMSVRLLIAAWPENAPRGSVAAFCREHGVSTSWFYKVLAIARSDGQLAALRTLPRRPRVSPQRTAPELASLALSIRAELVSKGCDAGPLSVMAALRRSGVTPPSRATLARLFTSAGVVTSQPRKRPRSSYQRFVYPAPNSCWQIDAMEWALADGTKVAVFQIIDDHSRLAIASLVADAETSHAAVRVVQAGIDRHGVPQRFLSDNGLAFNPTRRVKSGQLVDMLLALGVEPITGKPYKPTTQGKNERSHQTLQRYLRARPAAATIADLQRAVDAYDEYYNTHREHQGLSGNSTPREAWNRTATAAAPTPPTGAAVPPGPRSAVRTADVTGAVGIDGNRYQLGRSLAQATIHILLHDTTIDFFDPAGTHQLTHKREPVGQRSYIGKPDHNRVSTKS